MTIDTGWTKLIKKNVPQAFTQKLNEKPTTVFIDGQIKLMCGTHIRSWQQLVRSQFIQCIESAFATGACIVVLAFDNYEHVPAAKNMTQAKRSKQHVHVDFDASDDLPALMPENWNACMRNRCFKNKVMHMIINTLRVHYTSGDVLQKQGRTVILDFVQPEVFGAAIKLPDAVTNDSGKRGECDVKAFNWACYGPMLIFSTDGDYLMIALMQLERMQQTATDNEIRHLGTNSMQCELRVKPKNRFITEQEYITDADGESWTQQKPASMQRFYLWRMTTNIDSCLKRKAESKTKQQYEYVNIQAVLAWLQQEMLKVGCVGLASDNLASLVAATGCDFCMSLPNVGPIKIWQQRWAFKNLNLTSPLDLLQALSCVYATMYASKVPATVMQMKAMLNQNQSWLQTTDKKEAYYDNYHDSAEFDASLQHLTGAYDLLAQALQNNANVSEVIKKRTWSHDRLRAHVLNAIWTLRYWMFLHDYPDPLTGFGFVRNKNRVEFEAAV